MGYTKTSYDRYRLYGEVWTEPVRVVAKRYGVSDVALAKTCRSLAVPLPPPGFWARLRAGQAVQQPSLPEYTGPTIKEVRRWIVDNSSIATEQTAVLNTFAETPVPETIHVPPYLENPHSLTKRTDECLRSTMTNLYGVFFNRSGIINLRVSPELLDRALRIMNSLILAVEGLGFAVTVGGAGNTRSFIDVRGIKVEFMLEEEVHGKAHVPSIEEMRKISQGQYVWMPRRDYRPVGILKLRISGVRIPGVVVKTFRDTYRKRVEDRLTEFIRAVLKVAAYKIAVKRELAR